MLLLCGGDRHTFYTAACKIRLLARRASGADQCPKMQAGMAQPPTGFLMIFGKVFPLLHASGLLIIIGNRNGGLRRVVNASILANPGMPS